MSFREIASRRLLKPIVYVEKHNYNLFYRYDTSISETISVFLFLCLCLCGMSFQWAWIKQSYDFRGLYLNFDFYLITLHVNNPKEHINAGITSRKKFIKFCVDKVGKHVHVHVGEKNSLRRRFEQLTQWAWVQIHYINFLFFLLVFNFNVRLHYLTNYPTRLRIYSNCAIKNTMWCMCVCFFLMWDFII